MSSLIFPTPAVQQWNWKWPLKKTIQYSTIVQTPASGLAELRIPLYNWPRWKYSLDIDYIRGSLSDPASVLQKLVGFYMAVQGSASDWLFDESQYDDGSVTSAAFGTGDGTTLSFQLSRPIGAGGSAGTGTDIIQDVKGTPTIFVNGVPTGSFTLTPTGVVTFGTAPALSAALTWTGSFYRRCRFVQDSLPDLQSDMYRIWSLHTLEFISVILGANEFVSPFVVVNFADEETPAGAINGINTSFTLAHSPNPPTSLQLYLNGLLQDQGVDYTLSTNVITFTNPPSTGDILLAWYRY